MEVGEERDTVLSTMTFRERFLRTMRFEPVDRLPDRHAYGLMPGVLEAWHREGLPTTVTSETDILKYFGFPERPQGLPIDMGPRPTFEQRVIEETDEYCIAVDKWGRKTRMMKGVTTLALGTEFPVADMASWQPYEERLRFTEERIGANIVDVARTNVDRGCLNGLSAMGFYWFPRDLMGDEELAVAYYQQPELVHRMNDTWCSLLEQSLLRVLSLIKLDVVHLNEDMAYKNGSMIGKHHFDEFIAPYYQRIRTIVEEHGIPVFSVDSDGNLGQLNDWFVSSGVNLIGPNEVRAGNDIAEYRRKYGTALALDGGIDKTVLPLGRDAIDEMLGTTVSAMMESGGGWVVSLDHRVVPGTRLADFEYYLERVRALTTY